jgi:hypothetical protein
LDRKITGNAATHTKNHERKNDELWRNIEENLMYIQPLRIEPKKGLLQNSPLIVYFPAAGYFHYVWRWERRDVNDAVVVRVGARRLPAAG